MCPPKPLNIFQETWNYTQAVERVGSKSTARLVWSKVVYADIDLAQKAQIDLGMPLFCIRRVRVVNGSPASIETAHVNLSLCPSLPDHDFEQESLYDVLLKEGNVHVTHGKEHISISRLNADEAKLLGGLGPCGRPICCGSFLSNFQPVSIKMAKEQSLSLNPVKISGTCGRLMCCLKYEQEAYEDLLRTTPKVGALVGTVDGKGKVVEVNLLSGLLKVRLDANPDAPARVYPKEEVHLLRDGRIKVDQKEIEALKEIME